MADKPAKKPKRKQGKQKIEIRYIKNQTTRKQTFRKRAGGLFKKAYELAVLCGATVLLKLDQNEPKGKSEKYHYFSWKPAHENKIPKYKSQSKKTADETMPPPSESATQFELPEQQRQQQQQQIFDEDNASLEALLDEDDYIDCKGNLEEFLGEALGNVF